MNHMITNQKYLQLKNKIKQFEQWLDGRTSYSPSDIPPGVSNVTNAERSQVEVYEFVTNPPDRYFCYVKRNIAAPGVVDNKVTLTTWTGQILGYGYLGKCYFTGVRPFQSKRYTLKFTGINEVKYKGVYYASSGDYCRIRKIS